MRLRMIHAGLPFIAGAAVLVLAGCTTSPSSADASRNALSPGDVPIVSMHTTIDSTIGFGPKP